MKFWVVTPSYNQLDWLKLCIASLADQASESVQIHHHVQDACSSDGTTEWLEGYFQDVKQSNSNNDSDTSGYTFNYSSEKDGGMYDAINRGWKLASDDVDVIAHLNCDEQYLPGALQIVAEYFLRNFEKDVVLADMVVVDINGDYICHRRSLKPYPKISRLWCAGFTATTFQRAAVIKEKGVFFDTKWKNIGDKVWYNDLHKAGCSFGVLHEFASVFTDTGENLNWTAQGREEGVRYINQYLPILRGNLQMLQRLSKVNSVRRVVLEMFCKKPTVFSLYRSFEAERVEKRIDTPRGRWGKKAWKVS